MKAGHRLIDVKKDGLGLSLLEKMCSDEEKRCDIT